VTADLIGLSISGGATSGKGGGLCNLGTITLSDCTVTANSANSGGGLANPGGTTTLTGSTSAFVGVDASAAFVESQILTDAAIAGLAG
jgi:hypothetical protein